MDNYIYHDGKMLRRGYTTGTCAAAASAAAARMLFGMPCDEIELRLPGGDMLTLRPVDMKKDGDTASCAVIKDSGDDPDITNGIAVYSAITLAESGFEITGGRGVGKVTKPGLDRPVGDYAINTVPRSMIKEAVLDVCSQCGYDGGIRVEIYIPEGESLAEKTYNPRLGIIGGISVIGTSGIVEPMSTRAILETVRVEMNMRKAEGKHSIVLTLGNYGEGYLAKELSFIQDRNVKCSNFIGDALDMAMEMGFENVLIAGHIGKLVKLGTGIMNTHSAQADGRIEVLVMCALLADADIDTLRKLAECVSTDAALDILNGRGLLRQTMDKLMERTQTYLDSKTKGRINAGALMFSNVYGFLGQTEKAGDITAILREEYS